MNNPDKTGKLKLLTFAEMAQTNPNCAISRIQKKMLFENTICSKASLPATREAVAPVSKSAVHIHM